jgi:hypothetical protein
MVQRTETHITDSLAVRKVLNALSHNWVLRDLSERDYGIDLMAEYFEESRPTGRVAFFQIKGTRKQVRRRDGHVVFYLPRKTLAYAECFAVPLFLIYCSLIKNAPTFFIHLQKYIECAVDLRDPDWRKSRAGRIRIEIPERNVLDDEGSKLVKACGTPQTFHQMPRFLENLDHWRLFLQDLFEGHNPRVIQPCVKCLERIAKLKVLLAQDPQFVSDEDLKKGIGALRTIETQWQGRGHPFPDGTEAILNDLKESLEYLETGLKSPSIDEIQYDATGDAPY